MKKKSIIWLGVILVFIVIVSIAVYSGFTNGRADKNAAQQIETKK